MSAATPLRALSDGNKCMIHQMVAEHGWSNGPWTDAKLDIDALYIGKLARDTTHPDWAKMFTASAGGLMIIRGGEQRGKSG